MVRALAVPFVLFAVLLAGCSGGGAGGDGDGTEIQLQEVDPAAGKGAISGVVVDETIRPIAKANVTLGATTRGNPAVTQTDASGLFVFSGLEPGFYTMTATAPGYLAVQATADVVAGETAKIKVQLPADLTPVPFHTTYKHDGFMNAWLTIAQWALEDNLPDGTPLCDCRLFFTPEPGATTIIYEAFWDDSLIPNPGEFEFYYVVAEFEGDASVSGYCTSPCYDAIDADGAGFDPETEAYARLDGPDEWVMLQQPFQLFVTVWANGEAPDGWTVADQG